jgi:hypothetical protein
MNNDMYACMLAVGGGGAHTNLVSCMEVWESELQGVQSCGAYGTRDVLIIRSSESLEGPEIVPRRKGTLTAEDRDSLTSQDIPEECWEDDVKLIEARYRRDRQRFTVLPVVCGDGLTSRSVLERIRKIMKMTDKPGGKKDIVT